MPRHDRRKLAPVRTLAGADRRHDLRVRPVAEARVFIGRQVRAVEDSQSGYFKPDFRSAEKPVHVRLAEKYPGVWQSVQDPSVTRYLPRSAWAFCACAFD